MRLCRYTAWRRNEVRCTLSTAKRADYCNQLDKICKASFNGVAFNSVSVAIGSLVPGDIIIIGYRPYEIIRLIFKSEQKGDICVIEGYTLSDGLRCVRLFNFSKSELVRLAYKYEEAHATHIPLLGTLRPMTAKPSRILHHLPTGR